MFVLILGLLMALLSFAIDYLIEKIYLGIGERVTLVLPNQMYMHIQYQPLHTLCIVHTYNVLTSCVCDLCLLCSCSQLGRH